MPGQPLLPLAADRAPWLLTVRSTSEPLIAIVRSSRAEASRAVQL